MLVFGCHRAPRDGAPPPAPAPRPTTSSEAPAPSGAPVVPKALRELSWHYDGTPFGASDVVVAIPSGGAEGERFPVLVAFHGRGESLKGPKRGARGWVDDYELGRTMSRLWNPPLDSKDFLGMVTGEHLSELNADLARERYRGLIVVCPFLPDVLRGSRGESDGRLLARFVVEDVLPRVYRETPALGTAATTGVDGVSLGGRAALFVGFERPEAFGTVGALQPALDNEEAVRVAQMAQEARGKNPAQSVRLLTSDEDYFLEPTRLLSRALLDHGVPHRFDVVVGNHSYEFNRGPGGYEMLLFHDRALRVVSAAKSTQ